MSAKICPILSMAAAITTAIGYSENSAYDMARVAENTNYGDCMREGCAVWTRYGCGLSHNITTDKEESS